MANLDVVIIGAGASGLMCAIEAAKRGRRVRVVDHANKAGKKILMSGGGRCNFTNYLITPENYLSHNPHFCKSALSRYTQWDFLTLINEYNISYHEREHGQLFCDHSARDILDMLLEECRKYGVGIQLNYRLTGIGKREQGGFRLFSAQGEIDCATLVVASGGLSIPKMGASPFGYRLAEQFGIAVVPTRAGLVPFTWQPQDKEKFAPLAGIAIPARVSNQRASFQENVLFTHRGLSGPAILQLSSYWCPGEAIEIDLLPGLDVQQQLKEQRRKQGKIKVKTWLSRHLPKRLLTTLLDPELLEVTLQNGADNQFDTVHRQIKHWSLRPNGTEGYRTAEVTVGGVDCDEISSKTMESHKVPGLYFIGEVLDVTGWLGGYNFQWAWSSGWCAGQYV